MGRSAAAVTQPEEDANEGVDQGHTESIRIGGFRGRGASAAGSVSMLRESAPVRHPSTHRDVRTDRGAAVYRRALASWEV